MRTLSRPMFNMGGPIKQGIMTGIREPYKHGGKMLLVGQHPKEFQDKSGREKHLAPILMGIAHGARMALPWAARMGARYIKPLFGTTTPGSVTRGAKVGKKAWKKLRKQDPNIAGPFQNVKIAPDKFNPNWLGRDPIVKGVGIAGKSIFNPTVGGWVGKGVRLATSPSTIVIGGLYYANGRWFNKQGEELDPKSTEVAKAKAKGGDKDYGPHTKGAPTMTASMIEAKAKADKEKRINALLDTMGYDKARKNAAYDALIDAGRMVSERGTLDPKNIGRELIDPIVAATSQRFDKPEQIREAVGLMQVKADIAKQMEDPQVAEQRRLNIEIAKKGLEGKDFSEVITDRITRGEEPTGSTLASILRATEGIDAKVIDTAKKPQGKDALDWVTEIVKNSHTNPELPPHPAGTFVVSNRVLIIDEQGNITPYL